MTTEERREAWLNHRRVVLAARKAHADRCELEGLSYVEPPELPLDAPDYWRPDRKDGELVEIGSAPNPLAGNGTTTIPAKYAGMGNEKEVHVPAAHAAEMLGQRGTPPKPPEPKPRNAAVAALDALNAMTGRSRRR